VSGLRQHFFESNGLAQGRDLDRFLILLLVPLVQQVISGLMSFTKSERTKPGLLARVLQSYCLFYFSREEFTRHGMDDIVTLTHRNVCKDGFTVVDTVDAGFYSITRAHRDTDFSIVFLDLPAPWEAIDHAKTALRVRFLLDSLCSLSHPNLEGCDC
jgi:hypothetical protein